MINARFNIVVIDNAKRFLDNYDKIFDYNPYNELAYLNTLDTLFFVTSQIIENQDSVDLNNLKCLPYDFPIYRSIDIILELVKNIKYGRNIHTYGEYYYYFNIDKDAYLYTNTKYLSSINLKDF